MSRRIDAVHGGLAVTTFQIALATADDVPGMLGVFNWAALHSGGNFATDAESGDAWMHVWRETSSQHPWLVAFAGRELLGFARSSPYRSRGAFRHTAEVSLYISPEHLGRGIGTALYRVLLPLLRAQQYATLFAGIADGNTASERLHARAGFIRCGTLHRAGYKLGRWLDLGYWELQLQTGDGPPARRSVEDVWAELANGRCR